MANKERCPNYRNELKNFAEFGVIFYSQMQFMPLCDSLNKTKKGRSCKNFFLFSCFLIDFKVK